MLELEEKEDFIEYYISEVSKDFNYKVFIKEEYEVLLNVSVKKEYKISIFIGVLLNVGLNNKVSFFLKKVCIIFLFLFIIKFVKLVEEFEILSIGNVLMLLGN